MELWLSLLQTWPGGLIATGILIGLLVFILPMFMEAPKNTKATDRIILFTDIGLSIASTLIGLGLLWIQFEYSTVFRGIGGFRFVIPGFFFAFAGFKTFGGAGHWTRFRA